VNHIAAHRDSDQGAAATLRRAQQASMPIEPSRTVAIAKPAALPFGWREVSGSSTVPA
jgi:hypothetical protein